MLRSWKVFEEFERNLIRNSVVDYKKNLKIYAALYEQAVKLGVLPIKDIYPDIALKTRVSKAFNSVRGINKEDSNSSQ